MQVYELMSAAVSVAPGDTARDAARLLCRRNVGALPVVNGDGMLMGIVTDRDIVLRCLAPGKDADSTLVREVMSRQVRSVAPQDALAEAVAHMREGRVRRLPVAEGGRLVGMLSLGDLARCQRYSMEAAQALAEISSNLTRR